MAPNSSSQSRPAQVDTQRTARIANLRRVLAPRSIAFIGGAEAAESIRQSLKVGYQGEIWPVNGRHDSLADRPCFHSLDDLPAAPDAAFIAVPREATVEVVRALAASGAGGAVCYAAGFAEQDAEGADLQRELVEAAGAMALVGPNCYGLLNYLDGAALWPEGQGGAPIEKGVALVLQSGNMGLNITMQERDLPLAYMISVGNQANLGLGDYLEALLEDPRVTVIGFYIEGLTEVAAFAAAAAKALAKGVPLVALKTGNSEIGARVALSHTSSLAGSEALYDALFDRLAIARARSLPGLLETLKLFALAGPSAGNRLGVITCSGAEASLAADLGDQLGLAFPELTPDQRDELEQVLSGFARPSNPLDYNTAIWGNRPALEACFTGFLDGPLDAAALVIDYPKPGAAAPAGWDMAVDALAAAKAEFSGSLAVISTLQELMPTAARARALAGGLVPLLGLQEGMEALGAAARYGLRRPMIDADRAGEILRPNGVRAATGPRTLDEQQSKARLAAAGFVVPEGRLVAADEAVAAATTLGFPVALKAVDAAFSHKSEQGAVKLGLADEAAVAGAVEAITAALGGPKEGPCFLVERMVTGAVAELILGLQLDPQFGLALVVGSGGLLVELVGDSSTLLLPTCREDCAAALEGLKISRLLDGYRGAPPGDRDAVIEAMLRLADFAAAARDELLELDINPLMVLPRGKGVVAADALIRLRQA